MTTTMQFDVRHDLDLAIVLPEVSPLAPAILEAWSKALDDPSWKQGTGLLYNPTTNGYCCLGILGRIIMTDFPEFLQDNRFEIGEGESYGLRIVDLTNEGSSDSEAHLFNSSLPNRLSLLLGLPSSVAKSGIDGRNLLPIKEYAPNPNFNRAMSAAALNDGQRLSFPEIAQVLRDQYILPEPVRAPFFPTTHS